MLDTLDKTILELLQENARRSFTDIARQVGLSSPAVTERIKRLEQQGIIEGYQPILNYKKLGISVQAVIFIEVRYSEEKAFTRFVKAQTDISECHHTLGDTAFLLRARLESLDALELLVNKLMRFGQTTTHVLMSSVKNASTV